MWHGQIQKRRVNPAQFPQISSCACFPGVHFAALQWGCKYFRSCLSANSEILSLFSWPHLQAAEHSYENSASPARLACVEDSKADSFCVDYSAWANDSGFIGSMRDFPVVREMQQHVSLGFSADYGQLRGNEKACRHAKMLLQIEN